MGAGGAARELLETSQSIGIYRWGEEEGWEEELKESGSVGIKCRRLKNELQI